MSSVVSNAKMVVHRVRVMMYRVCLFMLEHFGFLGWNQTDKVAQISVVLVFSPLAHDVTVGALGWASRRTISAVVLLALGEPAPVRVNTLVALLVVTCAQIVRQRHAASLLSVALFKREIVRAGLLFLFNFSFWLGIFLQVLLLFVSQVKIGSLSH